MQSQNYKLSEGSLSATGIRCAIVASRFNSLIVDKLISGALSAITRNGGHAEQQQVVWVPGAFEIPQMTKKCADSGKYDAIITLGCVLKGETDHNAFVAGEAIGGITNIAISSKTPVTLGILTADSLEQALARAGSKMGNHGWNAAVAAIELANLNKILEF